MSCEICGGSTKCPKWDYKKVENPTNDDFIWIPIDQETPKGYVVTHERPTRKLKLCFREKNANGLRLEIVGNKQSRRIAAHFGVSGWWCGMSSYAFYVEDNKNYLY